MTHSAHCVLALTSCLAATVALAGDPPAAVLVECRRIWDHAPHNAFTDLVRYNDRWFCTFREGRGHASFDGSLRVLRSGDGAKWESAEFVQ
jgi:hypothetical protein